MGNESIKRDLREQAGDGGAVLEGQERNEVNRTGLEEQEDGIESLFTRERVWFA